MDTDDSVVTAGGGGRWEVEEGVGDIYGVEQTLDLE